MSRRRIPTYRRYKPRNLGLVVFDGKQHYFGPYGSPESLAEYERLIQEWIAKEAGTPTEGRADRRVNIDELILAFWEHAEKHYRKPDGSPSGEQENLKVALRRLYGKTSSREFGPVGLRAVRAAMVETGLSRTTVNARINRIRRVFKWAASVELLPATISQSLQTVPGLQRGLSGVRESAGVQAVSIEQVEAALPFMSRPVAAMARLQLLTGCRVGEVMAMRGRDLVLGESCGEYRPRTHKNAWRGIDRVIPLGPQARAIVREFLRPDPDAPYSTRATRSRPAMPDARPDGRRGRRPRRSPAAGRNQASTTPLATTGGPIELPSIGRAARPVFRRGLPSS